MHSRCGLHITYFREMKELNELEDGKWIQEFAGFVLAGPSCHGQRSCNDDCSEREQISAGNMKVVMHLRSDVLKPANHGHLYG